MCTVLGMRCTIFCVVRVQNFFHMLPYHFNSFTLPPKTFYLYSNSFSGICFNQFKWFFQFLIFWIYSLHSPTLLPRPVSFYYVSVCHLMGPFPLYFIIEGSQQCQFRFHVPWDVIVRCCESRKRIR